MEVVTGALPSVITKLGELLVGEYKLQKGVKGEIRFLQAELESMKGALEKVSNTPADHLDIQDKIWARDLRELSYDIEDHIDTFMVRVKEGPRFAMGLLPEIRDIKIRVEEVAKRHDRYKISSDAAKPIMIDPRLLTQYEKVTELVGIDEAIDELIKTLEGKNEASMRQHGKIVSIVGFGGLGKTTLANAVYEKISTQFHCRAFVSVSQTPDVKKLFKSLLNDLGNITCDETSDETRLIRVLKEFLQEKRYFVVIDDIWDISIWKMIRCALPDNDIGYTIITTTHKFDVAEVTGIAYKLRPLSLNNSRKLLYRRIFGNQNKDNSAEEENCPDEELAEVSDKILNKCSGVPLAIITMASLLASKARNKLEWYEVHNSIGTGLENNLDVLSIRRLSIQNGKESNVMMAQATRTLQHARSVVVFPSVVAQVPAPSSCHVLRVLELRGCDLSQANSLKGLGNLYQLRYLGLRETRISQLPEEIGNLKFLQTLDLWRNHISSLPLCVVQLRNLICLSIDETTRVPNGFGNLSHLEQLSELGIVGSATNMIEELAQLTELRLLAIRLDKWNNKLSECLCKLQKIQYMYIMGNSSQRSIGGLDALVAPRHLRELNAGTSCLFSTLPAWVNPSLLLDLTQIYIAVTELSQVDLEILGRLPALRDLTLEVSNKNIGILQRVVVGAGWFPCLVYCMLDGFVWPVVFQQGAAPRLRELWLTPFHVLKARGIACSDADLDMGLGNLPSLQTFSADLRYKSTSEALLAQAVLTHAAEVHPNHPRHMILIRREKATDSSSE
ncbi:unnamed protein product [Urochloa decumbens]|uniref:Uncharacterized protein n=1 Tax=Urochloa decumbens TaxID=240449 RepID=A0ABC9B430_9POAL